MSYVMTWDVEQYLLNTPLTLNSSINAIFSAIIVIPGSCL